MRAAVVPCLGAPLRDRGGGDTHRPAPARSSSRSRRPGCATPTSTPREATGPSSRSCRSIPGHEGVGQRRAAAGWRRPVQVGRPGRAALARHGLRALPVLRGQAGRPTAVAAVHGLHDRRRVRRLRGRRTPATWSRSPTVSPGSTRRRITCAGVTTYKALKVARPQPAETAMIVGIGGLGHMALQYARIFGTTTVAVDVGDSKLQLAKDLGADHVVDGRGDQAGDSPTSAASTSPS